MSQRRKVWALGALFFLPIFHLKHVFNSRTGLKMDLLKKNLNQFSPLYPPRYNSVTEYPSERAPAKKQFPASHPDVDLSVLNMSFSTLSLSCWTVFCLRVGGNNSRYHGV